jgi:hypothetical protein
MTSRVMALVQRGQLNVLSYLARHLNGDWGDVSQEDWQANQRALRDHQCLRSSYVLSPDLKFCLITESDRSMTQALLSDES